MRIPCVNKVLIIIIIIIHAHISLWNGLLDTCRGNIKYLFCVRNSVKYVKVALSSKFMIVKLYSN